MNIQTYSIITGSEACNARCPYCVSMMTPNEDLGYKEPEVNWRNFDIGCRYAKDQGVSTVMLTGKGEPTLFPEQITKFMKHLEPYKFPFIELQTNGIPVAQGLPEFNKYLREWYQKGMTFVALSVVHYEPEKNRQIYVPHLKEYIDLPRLIDNLHSEGLSVRLSVTMLKDYIDSVKGIEGLVDFARKTKTEQLTVRPVSRPNHSRNCKVAEWVSEHQVPEKNLEDIIHFLETKAAPLQNLAHGAKVYDLEGQNICLSNALTIEPGSDQIRQLIFFPDGHLRYDWQHMGAVLL